MVYYGDTLYREITIEEGLQLLLRKVEVVVMCLSSNWEDRQLVPAFPFFGNHLVVMLVDAGVIPLLGCIIPI